MVDTETKRMSCWGASDWRTPGQALLSPSFRRYREEIATGNPELDVSYVRGGEVVLENNFIVLWDSDRPDKPYSPAKVPKVLAGKTEI
jgi:hypothetical protein